MVLKGPNSSDPKFHIWDEEDSTISSWLWNSMVLEISGTCVFLTSAKEIWDVVNETYSKVCDTTQIFEIKMRIFAT